jgi:hypothetical protein
MDLREGEQIMKVYHHHPTPFVFDVMKVILGTFPFFLMIFLFESVLSTKWYILLHLMIFALFALIIVYVALIYWLDKLIITNHRIIYIDWKYLTVRDESEALLNDIQDIQTEEKGILSTFAIFDYGLLRLDTASSYITIEFFQAPDPEGIRKFIYHVKGLS